MNSQTAWAWVLLVVLTTADLSGSARTKRKRQEYVSSLSIAQQETDEVYQDAYQRVRHAVGILISRAHVSHNTRHNEKAQLVNMLLNALKYKKLQESPYFTATSSEQRVTQLTQDIITSLDRVSQEIDLYPERTLVQLYDDISRSGYKNLLQVKDPWQIENCSDILIKACLQKQLYNSKIDLTIIPAECYRTLAEKLNHYSSYPCYVDLSDARLAALPADLGNVCRLEGLSVRSTQISTLAQRFAGLASLEELDVSDCAHLDLSSDIAHLKELKRLSVHDINNADVLFQDGPTRTVFENLPNIELLTVDWSQLKKYGAKKDLAFTPFAAVEYRIARGGKLSYTQEKQEAYEYIESLSGPVAYSQLC